MVLQGRFVFSLDASIKLETLPSSARVVPGDYVVMLDATADIDDFIATLSDDDSDDQLLQMNIMYVYNHTLSSPSSGTVKAFIGLALSNVSDIALEALLASEKVATITPVSFLNRVHHH
jgi:hypothetical protein